MTSAKEIVGPDDLILLTGGTGYIGSHVLAALLDHGFRHIRCFTRASSDLSRITALRDQHAATARVEVMHGNLLSRDDCLKATKDVMVVYHLAIGGGGRSYPDAYMNAVVTTRNLLAACASHKCIRRFVNLSSFAVYTNRHKPRHGLLDESCPVEDRAESCGEAYCYAKVRQDEMVIDYGKNHGIPYVILRPGVVYGPGKDSLSGRIGLGTFGIFLHLGGPNIIPFTYLDNCAQAIVLAGVVAGVDGEVFNIVDDDLPSSREFLWSYKRKVKYFPSLLVPRPVSYLLCLLWEKAHARSQGQLPEFVNRRAWHAYWRGARYSNDKLKRLLGWKQTVPTTEGLKRFFASCRKNSPHA